MTTSRPENFSDTQGIKPAVQELIAGDPQRIDGYWLAGRLGSGGQGVVYDAYDGEGHRVAIKVLHSSEEKMRDQLAKEAAVTQRVASFCTARVLAVQTDARKPYIVSEYVAGPSLRAAQRIFIGDDLHRLGTAIATALTTIHDAGVTHRDLKPDNVLLSPDGPRVIDFGIARTQDMSLTATGLVTGTPTYMAPEVFTGQRADTKADVFAWGAIMVFAATGEDPFKADNLGGVMHRVLSVHPDLSTMPRNLRPLVEAALEKDPATRPSARDLLLALVSGDDADTRGLLTKGSRTARDLHVPETVDPALGTLAEDAYGALTPETRELVPEVFLRFVSVDQDGRESGRRVSIEELLEGRPERETVIIEHILQTFSYLITRKGDDVALTRPALLRAWPRLRQWIDADRDGLPVLNQITTAARYWADHGRRIGDLLQGSRLEHALSWATTGRRHLTLTPQERDFLTAGTLLTKKRARRRRLTIAALAGLLVVALVAGGLAVRQSEVVAEQRDRATGRQLAVEADQLRTADPAKAMLLSVAGWRLAPDAETRSSMTASLYRPESAAFRQPAAKGLTLRAVSGDGRRLASVSEDGVRVYDVRTRRRTAFWAWPGGHDGFPTGAALSPSGSLLITATQGQVTAWDVMTGRKRAQHPVHQGAPLIRVAFGDHEWIVAITIEREIESLWDVRTGRAVKVPLESVESMSISADGRTLAAIRMGRLHVLRLPDMTEDTRFRRTCGRIVAFSPDSRHLLCVRGTITTYDLASGTRVTSPDGEWRWTATGSPAELDEAAHTGMRFSRDGRLLLGFADESIRLWDATTGAVLFTHRTEGTASDAWLDPDNRTIRYLQDDSVVSLDARPNVLATKMPKSGSGQAISPDGRWIATGGENSPIRIWDVQARRFTGTLPGSEKASDEAVFDRQGHMLVTQEMNGEFRAWEVATHTLRWKRPIPKDSEVSGMAFTPDGKSFVAAIGAPNSSGHGQHLLTLDAASGRQTNKAPLETDAGAIAFSADGQSLISVYGRILDPRTGSPVGTGFNTTDENSVIATSPAGPLMAVSGVDGTVALWDSRQQTALSPMLRGTPGGTPGRLAFSPDGALVAAITESETTKLVQLWDVATKRRLAAVPLYVDFVTALGFTGDSALLIVTDQQGTVTTLPVSGDRIARAVCRRAGRTLTPAEWKQHLGDVTYREICPAG
ncbi:serine/threonine-protein kinase [Nonomuraea sp. NPDC005983]|uniref:serine/threonine-protein kinase n=1 Tax=Nonomuraea sp. NPDC005983 TaxID=3155595 RepID=UPI0033A7B148